MLTAPQKETPASLTAKEIRAITDSQVSGVRYYENGYAEVLRTGKLGGQVERGERAQIEEFSAKSRNKMLFTVCTTKVQFNSLITLTYGVEFPLGGNLVKAQFVKMLKRLKRYGIKEYVWYLEFQKRNAPHFHVMVDKKVTKGDGRLDWLGTSWGKVIGANGVKYSSLRDRTVRDQYSSVVKANSSPRAWEAVKSRDGAIRYMAKYALKTRQKDVPENYRNVGRFWGVSSGVRRERIDSLDLSMGGQDLRVWLGAVGHTTKDWDVVPKYLYGIN